MNNFIIQCYLDKKMYIKNYSKFTFDGSWEIEFTYNRNSAYMMPLDEAIDIIKYLKGLNKYRELSIIKVK
jgi:hypothetical protein